ncbi:sushi, von Willebrand factor type A, EGF and pentraxin domain-containing protein 1-like isoform X1 [Clavelina lepadiformis]|uniref:sushi, von Willebrand factor type A, EGF and pentraxin domain-containing protein 1-like isoform X1 n=1 Tax=Clavelina lepadiformis TaxID=159417 RepID=UPI0040413BB2
MCNGGMIKETRFLKYHTFINHIQLNTFPEITCPRRTTPADARPSSSKSQWLVDDVLSYTCDVGYDFRGNPSSTCLVTGRWSNDLPNCRIRRCVHQDVPEHSTANPNKSQWVYGDRVTYTCGRGYELSGSAESRCTSSGRWSDPPPTCTIRSCEHPTPPRNVDIIRPANKMSWVYEDTITYGCSRGFRLSGAKILSCTEDGTWSHPVPTCQQITCERSDPDFGESIPRKERYIFEEEITYSCNEGFDLEGAIRSSCQASGSWNNDPPNCYLPGVWKTWGGWTPCSVTCGEGNRRRWRVCGRYGRTGGACLGSSLQDEGCSTPCPARKTSYSDKEYLIFRIEKNFNDARDACQNLGGDLALVKTEMIQNALSTIMGSLGRTPFSYGYFIGMTDQKQEGRWHWLDDTRLTHRNWNWREPNNAGNEDCGSMSRNGGWNDLACWRKTYYICERDMDPCSDTVCMNDGRCVADSNLRSYDCQCPSYTRGNHCERIFNPCWNSPCQSGNCHSEDGYYYCVCPENSFGLHCDNVVQCPKPRIEDIIQLLGNNEQDAYNVGTRLKFSFRDIEQTIEGYDEITCRRDGTWNKSPPNTCETLTCPSVTAPANGRIAESANRVHVRGSTIRFECNGGYEVERRESIRCRDDYTWDRSVPTCRERKCPDVSNPQNGRFVLESGNRFARSSTLRLECDEGYEVDGNDMITCRDDYTWSHSRPSCRGKHKYYFIISLKASNFLLS